MAIFPAAIIIVYAQWTNLWSLNYGVVIDLLCDLCNCCVVIELTKRKNVYGNAKVAAKIIPLLKLYVTLKWNEMFYFLFLQQCLPSQFTWFFSSLCLFVFATVFFFFFIIILLYFILLFFLYFTTHIFVSLIKDYKIYLVAKRPQQAC